jgi:hypothetical protein
VLIGLTLLEGLRVSEAIHVRRPWLREGFINIPGQQPCDCGECRARGGVWRPKTKSGIRQVVVVEPLQEPNLRTRQFGPGGGGGMGDRINWDAPYITSAHSNTRLYWASNFVYRSEDRGDTWTRISPDLTRNLSKDTIV